MGPANAETRTEAKANKDVDTKKTHRPVVADLMSTDLFTLLEDDNIETLEELMKWRRIRHVPVVDTTGALVGLVTHRDFLRIAVSRLAEVAAGDLSLIYRSIPIGEIMNDSPVAVSPQTSLSEAAGLLYENKFGCLPVLSEGKLVGIITEADFVKAFASWEASFKDEE